MLFSRATRLRFSAAMMALMSMLVGSASSADLATQRTQPEPSNVLYETTTFDDWSIPPAKSDWARLGNMLVSRGSRRGADFVPILAPYRPPSADYAVEADIRVIREGNSFGVVAREGTEQGGRRRREGYAGGIGANLARPNVQRPTSLCYLNGAMSAFIRRDCIAEAAIFTPGLDWHTYRLELNGNKITLRIDKQVMIKDLADNRFLSAGGVGLWSTEYQLEVRRFRVIALTPPSNP
jgi:hypothetical protein